MTKLTQQELEAGVKLPPRYIPPFPERSGYHWIRRYSLAPPIPLYWNADWHRNTHEGWGGFAEPDREHKWEYLGPCHMPPLPMGPPDSPPDSLAVAQELLHHYRIENWQLKAALGYPVPEFVPETDQFKCGFCDARRQELLNAPEPSAKCTHWPGKKTCGVCGMGQKSP